MTELELLQQMTALQWMTGLHGVVAVTANDGIGAAAVDGATVHSG